MDFDHGVHCPCPLLVPPSLQVCAAVEPTAVTVAITAAEVATTAGQSLNKS